MIICTDHKHTFVWRKHNLEILIDRAGGRVQKPHTHTHTHTHACTHMHMHTHTHACMHAHTHTHTHIIFPLMHNYTYKLKTWYMHKIGRTSLTRLNTACGD